MTSASRIAIVAAPERETLRARGPDAVDWLNGLVTSDLRKLGPGAGAFGLLLTKTGKIQSDVDVVAAAASAEASSGRPPSELLLGLGAGEGERMAKVLDAHLVMEDVELSAEPASAWVRLIGEGSLELARALPADDVVAFGSMGWVGAESAALVVPRGKLEALCRELARLGAPRAHQVSGESWDALRLAHAFPVFGTDYTSDDNPHEAALDRRAVSWDKGCYLGQEVVCMQDMRGRVKRRLAVLRISGDELPPSGEPVLAADSTEPAGAVRSAARADGGATLAFAALRAPYFDAKDRELRVGGRPAEIVRVGGA